MPEYISISNFAVKAGVTRQAIYLRLDKDLAAYCKEIDKRKMIDISALSLYTGEKACQDRQEECQDSVNSSSESSSNVSNELTSYLKEKIVRLRQELSEKDALISSKDKLLETYADKFPALAEREQEISAKALMTTGQA